MSDAERRCHSCRWWKVEPFKLMPRIDREAGLGYCIRFPPQTYYAEEEGISLFPITHNSYECGEWKKFTIVS